MPMRAALTRLRLVWAILGVTAILLQLIATSSANPGYLTDPSHILNFFSYFTILTNLAITCWFILALRLDLSRPTPWFGAKPNTKGALLVAGSVTILVYWTLLIDIPIPNAIGEIANFLLHLLVPLGLWLDWLLTSDPITITYSAALRAWLAFPIAFVLYTELRGPIAHWYPYFFLDPHIMGSLGALLLTILGMSLLFITMSSLVFWLYRKHATFQLRSCAREWERQAP